MAFLHFIKICKTRCYFKPCRVKQKKLIQCSFTQCTLKKFDFKSIQAASLDFMLVWDEKVVS